MDYDFDIGRPLNTREAQFLNTAKTRADRNGLLLDLCEKTYGNKPHLPGDFGLLPALTLEQYRKFAAKAQRAEFLYKEYDAVELLLVAGRRRSVEILLKDYMPKAKYAFIKATLARVIQHLPHIGIDAAYCERLHTAAFSRQGVVEQDDFEARQVPDTVVVAAVPTRHPEWATQPTPHIETGRQELRPNTLRNAGPDTTRLILTQAQFDGYMRRVPDAAKDFGAGEGARLRLVDNWIMSEIKRDRPMIDLKATSVLITVIKALAKQDEADLLDTFE